MKDENAEGGKWAKRINIYLAFRFNVSDRDFPVKSTLTTMSYPPFTSCKERKNLFKGQWGQETNGLS